MTIRNLITSGLLGLSLAVSTAPLSGYAETLKVVILSVVQGIAEFLPISSSGHLVVINELLGTGQGSIELNVILHLNLIFH